MARRIEFHFHCLYSCPSHHQGSRLAKAQICQRACGHKRRRTDQLVRAMDLDVVRTDGEALKTGLDVKIVTSGGVEIDLRAWMSAQIEIRECQE
jgi:hypothetical protein